MLQKVHKNLPLLRRGTFCQVIRKAVLNRHPQILVRLGLDHLSEKLCYEPLHWLRGPWAAQGAQEDREHIQGRLLFVTEQQIVAEKLLVVIQVVPPILD